MSWHHTLESKRKIGEANSKKLKGFVRSEEFKQKIRDNAKINPNFGMKGKKHSADTLEKYSQSRKGQVAWNKGLRGFMAGKDSPHWKGGISRDQHTLGTNIYRDWRNSVFQRDKFQCQMDFPDEKCKGMLNAHHIKRWSKYPELRYNTINGITLCQNHHPKKMVNEVRLEQLFTKLNQSKAHSY